MMLAIVARVTSAASQDGVDVETGDLYVGNTTPRSFRVASSATAARWASLLLLLVASANVSRAYTNKTLIPIAGTAVILAGITVLLTWIRLSPKNSTPEESLHSLIERAGLVCIAAAMASGFLILISMQGLRKQARGIHRSRIRDGSLGGRPESLLIARTSQFGVEAEMAKSMHARHIPKPLKALSDAHKAAQQLLEAKKLSSRGERTINVGAQVLGPDPDVDEAADSAAIEVGNQKVMLHYVGHAEEGSSSDEDASKNER